MFQESITVSLKLKVGGTTIVIPGGNVKRWSVDLQAYGFSGMAEFWLDAKKNRDELFSKFTQDEVIEVDFSFEKTDHEVKPPPDPISIKGVVTTRRFRETAAYDVEGSPVIFRRYRIEFRDIAAVMWAQHRPVSVRADSTLESLIRANLPSGLSLEMDWAELKTERGIVCLGLGADEASFYDFISWLADTRGGQFYYHYGRGKYQLADEKQTDSYRIELPSGAIEEWDVSYPELKRHTPSVLNSHTSAVGSAEVSQSTSWDGVGHDHLMHTPLQATLDSRQRLEATRAVSSDYRLDIRFEQYPDICLVPSAMFEMSSDDFSSAIEPTEQGFRAIEVRIGATAIRTQAEDDLDLEQNLYEIEYSASFERSTDTHPNLPDYRAPRWPIRAEGTIVCTVGDAGDKTYMMTEDSATSQVYYQVNIPLWNVTVKAPFDPHFSPGNLYFPAYRDSRVMLEIGFEWAQIARFLDWGDRVRLPADSQGDHILFGKNQNSETSMRHWYVNSKPELQIKRMESGDTELVVLKDGSIILETKEEEVSLTSTSSVDLTPEVDANKAKIASSSDESVAEVGGAVGAATSEVNAELEAAVGSTRETLESMDTEISAKVEEISSSIESAIGTLIEQGQEVSDAVADARSRLKKIIDS